MIKSDLQDFSKDFLYKLKEKSGFLVAPTIPSKQRLFLSCEMLEPNIE